MSSPQSTLRGWYTDYATKYLRVRTSYRSFGIERLYSRAWMDLKCIARLEEVQAALTGLPARPVHNFEGGDCLRHRAPQGFRIREDTVARHPKVGLNQFWRRDIGNVSAIRRHRTACSQRGCEYDETLLDCGCLDLTARLSSRNRLTFYRGQQARTSCTDTVGEVLMSVRMWTVLLVVPLLLGS